MTGLYNREMLARRLIRRILIVPPAGLVGNWEREMNREEMEVLFTLLADRYERGSVMLTSNLPFSKWEQIFKDAMTTAAAIDRLVHHSVILELNVPSYRLENAKKLDPRQTGSPAKSAKKYSITIGPEF